ncbi:UDP-N-acetylenolpyruvoylglucosamine reductase, partial [Pseudomonas syringae pv. tagetis]
NLSLIPVTVVDATMKNIGTYVVEIKAVIHGLTYLYRETGELRDFSLQECAFGYRHSEFKQQVARWQIFRLRFKHRRL